VVQQLSDSSVQWMNRLEIISSRKYILLCQSQSFSWA